MGGSMMESVGFVALYGAYLFFVLNHHLDQLARGPPSPIASQLCLTHGPVVGGSDVWHAAVWCRQGCRARRSAEMVREAGDAAGDSP